VAYLQGIRKSKSKLGNLERFMQKQKNFSLKTRQKQTYAPGELVLTNLIFREKPTEVRRIAICHPPFVIWCSSLLWCFDMRINVPSPSSIKQTISKEHSFTYYVLKFLKNLIFQSGHDGPRIQSTTEDYTLIKPWEK